MTAWRYGRWSWLWLSALPLAMLVSAGPATAQTPATPVCDRQVETGAPLPRPATSRGRTAVYAEPLSARQQEAAWMLETRQPVSVIEECGRARKIRAADGREGWLHLLMLEGEGQLEGEAMRRPAKTREDCQRLRNPLGIKDCEERLQREARLQQEQAQSTYLTGDQLRSLILGKTLEDRELQRHSQALARSEPVLTFFAPSGEVFMMRGEGGHAMRWRGQWRIETDQLCLPNAYWPCARFRRAPDGALIREYSTGIFYRSTVQDGRGEQVVAEVKRWMPDGRPQPGTTSQAPRRPPPPRPEERVLEPALSR